MIENNTQIFCDMDGVLVDFESTAISLTNGLLAGGKLPGVSRNKHHFYRVKKVHDEFGKNWRLKSGDDLSIPSVRKLMFSAISSNPGAVFLSMQPHKDGTSLLWPFINKTGMTVNILSAPINGKKNSPTTASDGKTGWIQSWLSPQPTNIIITPSARKHEYAIIDGVPNILIDDKQSTVEKWNESGGLGILHIPKNSEKTIMSLVKILDKSM